MNKKITFLTITLLIISIILIVSYAILNSTWESILFEDANLESEIRLLIDNPDSIILKNQLESISVLNLQDKNIVSLKGIENLINLRELNLENCDVNDLSPLSYLEKLEKLNLRNNQILSLESVNMHKLSSLPILKSLDLRHNVDKDRNLSTRQRLSDISILSTFTNLEELNLRDNNIYDISPLSTLVKLKKLDLSQNPIINGDISALGSLNMLEHLNLRETGTINISALSDFNLIYLNLHSNTSLISIEPLENIVSLEELVLRNVPVNDNLGYLNSLVNLKRLNLRNTNISDVTTIGILIENGALQDNLPLGINAELDLRDNPIEALHNLLHDGYSPIRQYWQNITYRYPSVLPDAATLEFFINEFMSSNSIILDEDGDTSDWIELFNPSDNDINIGDYYLSDSKSNPLKWRFPSNTILPANGYLVVWASGKDKITDNGEIHTNFSINSDGEPIIITTSDRNNVVDFVYPVSVPKNISYGRYPDGSSNWNYFNTDNITVNATNNDSEIYILPKSLNPVFSHSGGYYNNAFYLELIAPLNSSIYYTLDGSTPTINSAVYTEPLLMNKKVVTEADTDSIAYIPQSTNWKAPTGEIFCANVVRAMVISDLGQSNIVTQSYFVDDDMINRYSFPIMSIVTDSNNLFDEFIGILVLGASYDKADAKSANYFKTGIDWEREVHIEYYDENGNLCLSQNAGVRTHGGSSRTYPVKSLRLYARAEYDEQNYFNYEFFEDKDIDLFKRLILRSGSQSYNYTIIGENIAQDLLKPLNLDIQYSTPIILFINGVYFGIRTIKDRFDEYYLETHYGVDSNNVTIISNNNAYAQAGNNDGVPHYRNMMNFIFNNDMSDEENYAYVNTLMDIDNFIDYYIVEIYFSNIDWPNNNIRYWRLNTEYNPDAPYGHDGRWRWMVFDLDTSFAIINWPWAGKTPDQNSIAWLTGENWGRGKMFTSLLNNTSFKNKFINRFADLLNTIFEENLVVDYINYYLDFCAPEIEEHISYCNFPASVADWQTFCNMMVTFAAGRPYYARLQLIEYMGIGGGVSQVTLDTDSNMGEIRINSIVINTETTAVTDPNNWTGIYLESMPIELEAIAKEGYRFTKWTFSTSGVELTDDIINIDLDGDITITAHYELI